MLKPPPRLALPLAIVLVAIAVAAFLVWRHETSQPTLVPTRGMAAGTVVSSTTDAGGLRVTVRYDARGRSLETSGTLPASEFEQQGKVVWVCFDPAAPTDARLRLPMDQLCANGG